MADRPAPVEHLPLLKAAVEEAWAARATGDHPFGAVLANAGGDILLTAHNTVVTKSDATGHAEANLVRLASASFSVAELRHTTLYTSTEPCAMCAGAIYWSGIGRVVYALAEIDLAALSGNDPRNPVLQLPCREVFARGSRAVLVEGPFELPSASDVHAGFWHPAAD